MTETELRNKIATWGNQYSGISEGSTAHKELVDMFNNSGLCTRYKMTTSDAWCAMFVSDAFIANDLTCIFPCVECGCGEMITLAQKAGIWIEDDAHVPSIGDVILYDWDDSGKGDNTGNPDHVGIVQSISGSTMTIIEGNKSDTVATRSMQINGQYIRGYITPDYVFVADGDSETGTTTDSKEMTTTAQPEKIWQYLSGKIGNSYGVAGLMGNLQAESELIPINLQDSYEKKLGYTDASYTLAVDNGSYSKFTSDSAGYGLAQWTYSTRKKALLSYCQSIGASIGNLNAQLDYLWSELKSDYPSLLTTLQNATSVKSASDAVLTKFEQPADQGDSVKTLRASYGQKYYDTYAGTGTSGTGTTGTTGSGSGAADENGVQYANHYESGYGGGKRYTVTAKSGLNMRKGPSTDYVIITTLEYNSVALYYGYYDVDANGDKWLLVIASGTQGWICAKYVK